MLTSQSCTAPENNSNLEMDKSKSYMAYVSAMDVQQDIFPSVQGKKLLILHMQCKSKWNHLCYIYSIKSLKVLMSKHKPKCHQSLDCKHHSSTLKRKSQHGSASASQICIKYNLLILLLSPLRPFRNKTSRICHPNNDCPHDQLLT